MSLETQWKGLVDQTAVTVGATATKLITATALPGRPWKGVTITPTDGDIYYGGPSVTTATGQPLTSGTTRDMPIAWDGALYAIRAGGSDVNVRVTPAY